jgi:hypothetical protein
MTTLPSLETPDPDDRCPECGESRRVVGFCGRCAEEYRASAAGADTHSSDMDPGARDLWEER